ncbi:MAG: hypothetical protein AB1500_12070 [Bacillota bacterium]
MDAARQCLQRNRKNILLLPNVVGVGVGRKKVNGFETNEPAIVVFVEKKLPSKYLPRTVIVPNTIDEVKTDVVETGRFRLMNLFTARQRPARPGMSIGHYRITAGTFGAVVYDRKTDEPLILSNNHVLANATNGSDGRSRIGDPILQPGPYDGGSAKDDIIGKLERFIPMHYSAAPATCPVASGIELYLNILLRTYYPQYTMRLLRKQDAANKVDCAVAKPLESGSIKNDILKIGPIRGITEAGPGIQVRKSGRTSGVTTGSVTYIDVTSTVDIGDKREAVFEDQFATSPMSQGGDSGSLIVDQYGKVAGLLFAGSDEYTLCNHIHNVLDALNVRLNPKGGGY